MGSKLILLFKYELNHLLRARWLPVYALFFFFFTSAVMQFGGSGSKAVASLLSIALLIVPAVSILYATIYWYNSDSFTALLLTQPVRRSSVYFASWLAISLGLGASYLVSTGLALFAFRAWSAQALVLLSCGLLLTCIFAGLGQLIGVLVNDRMKGIGVALLAWIYFSILHDALTFGVISTFSEYPVEVPSMVLMGISPVDLTRVNVLLFTDATAMMGYTGRILQKLLSGFWGGVLTSVLLTSWCLALVTLGIYKFRRKDL